MTAEHQVAEPAARRLSGEPLRRGAQHPTILCGLWVAVIVLAVAIDLAK